MRNYDYSNDLSLIKPESRDLVDAIGQEIVKAIDSKLADIELFFNQNPDNKKFFFGSNICGVCDRCDKEVPIFSVACTIIKTLTDEDAEKHSQCGVKPKESKTQ